MEKWGFSDLWLKIGVLVENGGFFGKLGFWWKNRGFLEKRGFRGFLVKNFGKIRKEPGI